MAAKYATHMVEASMQYQPITININMYTHVGNICNS